MLWGRWYIVWWGDKGFYCSACNPQCILLIVHIPCWWLWSYFLFALCFLHVCCFLCVSLDVCVLICVWGGSAGGAGVECCVSVLLSGIFCCLCQPIFSIQCHFLYFLFFTNSHSPFWAPFLEQPRYLCRERGISFVLHLPQLKACWWCCWS